MLNARSFTLLGFILGAMATRLLPHPPNFTAIGALCLFGGVYFKPRWVAFMAPLVAIYVSDVLLSLYVFGYWTATPFKHVLFALTVAIGLSIRNRPTPVRIAGAAVAASLMFFVLSNFHVWYAGTMYPHTGEGLLACYVAAIPFAQNMLVGNLFYCLVLFGGWHLAQSAWPSLRAREVWQSAVAR